MPYDPNNPQYPQNPQDPQYPQNPQQPGYGQQGDYPTPQQPMYPPQGPGNTQPSYPPPQQPGYQYGAQPPYPQQPNDYPQQGQPPQQRRSRAGMIAAIIGGVILLCIVVCVGGLYALGKFGQGAASSILTTYGPTLTAAAQQLTPSPTETVIYQDTLLDSPTGWFASSDCAFKSDGYHVVGGTACLGPTTVTQGDADVQVTAQMVTTGQNTGYGIVLRRASQGNFYSFEVTPDGQWAFLKWVNSNGSFVSNLQSSAAINTGNGATNQLRVVAVGSQFTFYVNGVLVGSATDSTYSQGRVGVVDDDSNSTSEIIFTNFAVYQPAQ